MTNPRPPRSIPVSTLRDQPPETLEQLRELMLRISRGESDVVLGPKAHAALARILELQGNPALLSITALAQALAVNPSTLTRLARNLGYSGFGAFQQVLLNASMTPPGAFYSQQAAKALASGEEQSSEALVHLCRENQANIDRFLSMHDDVQFREAVSLISSAPRAMVYGIRQFHAFATFLVYGLRLIRSDVHLLDSNALGLAEGIASLDAQDVLILASCAPYSRQVAEVATVASKKPVKIVAVTDRADSPLIKMSHAAILVPHETRFLSNSLTTFILAAECLINACAAAKPAETKAALAERDRLITDLRIEL